jgi:hypothetical protein
MLRKRILLSLLVALLINISSGQGTLQGADSDGEHLEGTWIVDAVTNIPSAPPVTSLATFSRDGGVTETSSLTSVGPGHGEWIRIGNRKFALTVWYLRFSSTGQFIGSSRVRATFELDTNLTQGRGTFQAEVFDLNANLLFSYGGTSTARRIQVVPLP